MRTLFTAAIAAATILVAPANAQTQPYAAVTTEATPVRCGDSDRYYAVAQLEPGALVTVVGEARGWAEIVYPGEVGAFITPDDGQPDGQGSIVVQKATALRAPALASGPSGSWKPLMSRPINTGVKLQLIETVEGADGREFFRVRPPESARAYVKAAALRRATPAEADAGGVQTAAAPETGNNARPETNTPAATPPANTGANIGNNAADTNTRQANNTTNNTPANTEPEPSETRTAATDPVGNQTTQPVAAPPRQSQPSPLVSQIENLENRFDTLRADPGAGPEQFNELIAAFNNLGSRLASNPATKSLTGRVDNRVSVLELQRDIREQLAISRAESAEVAGKLERLSTRVRQLSDNAGFDFVGQLMASGVYDGTRLPLLFRVQSIGETVPRTIGYVQPGSVEDIDLTAYLGRPVGIRGTLIKDPVNGLRIINIGRIESIDASLVD